LFLCLRCGIQLAERFAFCGKCGAYIAGIPIQVEEKAYFSGEGELYVKRARARTKTAPLLARGIMGYLTIGRKKGRKAHTRTRKARGRLVVTNKALYCAGNKYAFDKILSITKQGRRRKSISLQFDTAIATEETAGDYTVEITLETDDVDSLFNALEQAKLLQQTIDGKKADVSLGTERETILISDDYFEKGQECETSEDFEGALENYTKAIEISSGYHWMHYMRGCIYQKMGEMEKASDDFRVFLLADDRQAKLGNSPWGFLRGAIEGVQIALQQAKIEATLSTGTLKRILRTLNPFDVDYSNKKLYNWHVCGLADTPEEELKMRKEEPQEAAYRWGVWFFLVGKHKKAIQSLDEAIEMNPGDARSYLFRGIVHALQSRKSGMFGPSRSAKVLSKTKALNDFERVSALSKDNALIENARMRAMVCALQECPRCGKTSIKYYHICQ
jgi:tetratricopeptide (TPR) repeat protein